MKATSIFEQNKILVVCKSCHTNIKYYKNDIPERCPFCGGKIKDVKTGIVLV